MADKNSDQPAAASTDTNRGADNQQPQKTITDLLDVMRALRTPVTGCPWDLEQDFKSIAPYTIEEAYEVADAIEREDLTGLKEELGDLLLQVVYHAQMANEQRAFAFDDVIDAIVTKMIRRHPHVFGTAAERAAGAAPGFWERLKDIERAEKQNASLNNSDAAATPPPPAHSGEASVSGLPSAPSASRAPNAPSVLENVPLPLPALMRAIKLQNKAARVGFDWPSLKPVFEKMREELAELEEAIGDKDQAHIEEEYGDLLFVIANVARHLKIDPEHALRGANSKFTRRFQRIEALLHERGKTPAQSNLQEMDELWDQAKTEERQ